MIKKILVAYDNGIQAQKALEAAIEIAGNTGAEIYIAAVYTIPIVYQGTMAADGIYPDNAALTSYFYETTRAHLETILSQSAEKVRMANIPVHTAIMEGSPGKMISQFADEKKIDLIAIGSHNRTAVNRFFMGSVSNYVLQQTKCLVLVAKD
ncbi:MAG: universal stress protein [Syntrophomonas sp.]|nr:universal stress protein [Syntrophomonas sp.]